MCCFRSIGNIGEKSSCLAQRILGVFPQTDLGSHKQNQLLNNRTYKKKHIPIDNHTPFIKQERIQYSTMRLTEDKFLKENLV